MVGPKAGSGKLSEWPTNLRLRGEARGTGEREVMEERLETVWGQRFLLAWPQSLLGFMACAVGGLCMSWRKGDGTPIRSYN